MAQVGRRGFLSSILLTFMSIISFLHDVTGTQTWTVGDSFGWNRSPPLSDDQWAAGKSIQVGDALLFSFTAGQHNILAVTEANLANCVSSDPIFSSTGDPTVTQLTSSGSHGFISGQPGDCAAGTQLCLQVLSSSGQGATPTLSPVNADPEIGGKPPPAGFSPPTGSPSNSRAPLVPRSSSNSALPHNSPPDSPPRHRPKASPPARNPPPGYAPNAAPNMRRGLQSIIKRPQPSPG